MFRHVIAATAVSLLATSAMAQQQGVEESGTQTIEANSPEVDRLRSDYDARFVDYDTRLADIERRMDEMEGVNESGEQTIDANSPDVDRVEPSAAQ